MVVRVVNGGFRGSKPCKECTEFLKKLQIGKISYSNDDGSITTERVRDLKSNHLSSAYRRMDPLTYRPLLRVI